METSAEGKDGRIDSKKMEGWECRVLNVVRDGELVEGHMRREEGCRE